jgi:hypothetical protein
MRFDTPSIKRLLLHCYIFKNLIVSRCSVLIVSPFIPPLPFSFVCWHVSSCQLAYLVILSGILCWKSDCKAWNTFIRYCVLICNLVDDHHTITAQLNNVLCYYVHIIHFYMFQSFGLTCRRHNWSFIYLLYLCNWKTLKVLKFTHTYTHTYINKTVIYTFTITKQYKCT